MKTFLLIPFMIVSSLSYAHTPFSQSSSKLSESVLVPTHHIRLITKEGYRLEGLLITSNDSQLIIFPGKYKEWKHKKNYVMVHYPYDKIGTVNLSKLKNPLSRIFKKSKKNSTSIYGCKARFLFLRKILVYESSES